MKNINKYDFSFTALSMQERLMAKVAKAIQNDEKIEQNEIGDGKSKTGERKLHEVVKRIKNLSFKQTNLLINGTLIEQKQIAFLSICKTYLFIRDFAVEIIREKLLVCDYQITDVDYIIFYRRKADIYQKMDLFTEKSKHKIRQVTFKILEQAGIIDTVKNKMIQPQIIENNVINTIIDDNKEWLKIFLMSDIDIENIN